MQTVSLVLVVMMFTLGALLAPVMGAEDHVMVTPNDLNGLRSLVASRSESGRHRRPYGSSDPLHDSAEIAR